MTKPESPILRSVALLTALGVSLFSAAVMAEHGGRDRTDRDVGSRSEARDVSDKRDRDHARVEEQKANRAENKSHEQLKSGDSSENNGTSGLSGSSGSNGKSGDSGSAGGSGSSNSGSSNSGSSNKSSSSSEREIETGKVAVAPNSRISTVIDSEGRQRRRGEVIMIGRAEALDAVRTAGYTVISAQQLGAFDETLARIRVSEGDSIERTLQALRVIAPNADIAPNHVFRPSQNPVRQENAEDFSRNSKTVANRSTLADIGVIDTGADSAWATLKSALVDAQGFAEGGYTTRLHGSIVAQIAAAEGAHLAVADVFGVDADNQLIASAEAIARAINWLLGNHVTLMNVSIEGPDNLVLAHVIRRALVQGAVIVAAAGNNGPASSPAYPAAYPGVIAVTAVDEEGRVYPRANRGDYIAFAARGVRVSVNNGNTAPLSVSGTSFAAPIVAAEIARRLTESHRSDVAPILASMQRDAVDLGSPGRDNVFGWGLVTSPRAVAAMAR